METMESLTTFFGWCSIINMGFLLYSATFLMLGRNWAVKMYSKFYGISEEAATNELFRFVATYKIMAIIFSIVPYFALKIMA
ncbi:MAG: hypothetical protein E2O68_08045 [Deltaproteobacteria bacterium]|nr:MAG: hypothetical protein E2O68_08045 [Deltaproteobacteria bacterium]